MEEEEERRGQDELEPLVKSSACSKQRRSPSIRQARAADSIIIRWREPERGLKTDEELTS